MGDRICVCARIRPQTKQEINDEVVLQNDNNNILIRTTSAGSINVKTFKLDNVFPEISTQLDVFSKVSPLLQSAIAGINCTIFAYGQTGTGKTHTMLGYDLWKLAQTDSTSDSISNNMACDKNSIHRGIIPRSMEFLFNHVRQSASKNSKNSFVISVSYIEIYNERIIDLLDCESEETNIQISTFAAPSSQANNVKPSLDIRHSKREGVIIPGCTELEVQSVDEVMECLWIGAKKRSVASTNMNDYSSRSHTIFRVLLTSKEVSISEHNQQNIIQRKSKICFVDLAGSEKWRSVDMTSFTDDRIKELTSINKSLSALGNCISALIPKDNYTGNAPHIPYRDSKLTRLLQDSLGGNTRTFFVVTLSAAKNCAEETLSTLQFADRAMKVQIFATSNVINTSLGNQSTQAIISSLNEKIASLTTQHQQVLGKQKDENNRLRDILKMLLQKLFTGTSESQVESKTDISQRIMNQIMSSGDMKDVKEKTNFVLSPGNRDASLNTLLAEECVFLKDENCNLRKEVEEHRQRSLGYKEEIQRILKIIYGSAASSCPADETQSNVGNKGAWLNAYHSWLQSQVSSSSIEFPTVPTSPANEATSERDKLLQRVSMMETSVLLQAEELQRAKQVFIKLTNAATADNGVNTAMDASSEGVPIPDNNPSIVNPAIPALVNPNPKSKLPMIKENALRIKPVEGVSDISPPLTEESYDPNDFSVLQDDLLQLLSEDNDAVLLDSFSTNINKVAKAEEGVTELRKADVVSSVKEVMNNKSQKDSVNPPTMAKVTKLVSSTPSKAKALTSASASASGSAKTTSVPACIQSKITKTTVIKTGNSVPSSKTVKASLKAPIGSSSMKATTVASIDNASDDMDSEDLEEEKVDMKGKSAVDLINIANSIYNKHNIVSTIPVPLASAEPTKLVITKDPEPVSSIKKERPIALQDIMKKVSFNTNLMNENNQSIIGTTVSNREVSQAMDIPGKETVLVDKPAKKKEKKKLIWKEFLDAESNTCYYFNRVTKVTTWDKPSPEELLMEA